MIPLVVPGDFNVMPYLIPNIGRTEIDDQLILFIAREQKKVLKKSLGNILYKAFEAGLEEATVEQRWIDLRDGVEYSIGAKGPYDYVGMKELLVPHIYERWLRRTFDQHTDLGITIAQTENSDVINPSDRLVQAHNDFVSKLGNCHNEKDTLWGFIYNSDALYLDVVDTKFDTIKQYAEEEMELFTKWNIFSL